LQHPKAIRPTQLHK